MFILSAITPTVMRMGKNIVATTQPALRRPFIPDILVQSSISAVISTLAVNTLGCGHSGLIHKLNKEG